MSRILIADDHAGLREVMVEMIQGLGHETVGVDSGLSAKAALSDDHFDLLVTDLRMPGLDGIGLIEAIREAQWNTQVIVMTAHGSVESAVKAMALGALDYVEKPFPLEAMEAKVKKALERLTIEQENQRLKQERDQRFGNLIGGSPPMQSVFGLIKKVAETSTPVLILGESGTGKELVCREIHRRSERDDRPFVAVNCAALAEGVLESELFGHEKGAFTGATQMKRGKFELAHEGTLFLDEVGEIPPATSSRR